MPKIDQERREERRSSLLDAARRCIGREGYRSLTVDDVCAAAGASKGMFYTYFGQKEDLLIALLDADADSLDDLMVAIEARTPSGRRRMHDYVRGVVERGNDPLHPQLQADLLAAVRYDDGLRDRFAKRTRYRRATLARWIADASARGEIADVPANALASILVALSDGLMLHHAADPKAFSWVNVRRAVDHLLDGLALD